MGYTQNQEHSKDMMFQWHHTHQKLLELKKDLFPSASERVKYYINTYIDEADTQFKKYQEEFHKNGGLDATIEIMNQEEKMYKLYDHARSANYSTYVGIFKSKKDAEEFIKLNNVKNHSLHSI